MVRKKHNSAAVHLLVLLISLVMLSGCGVNFFKSSNLKPSMLTNFWRNVRPVKDLAVAHYRLGRFYQQRAQHGKAVMEFSKAVYADPGYVNAYNALGVAYDALHQYEDAENAFRKAISLAPERACLHNNLGYSYLCRKDFKAAVACLEKAAALDDKARIKNNLELARAGCAGNVLAQENRENRENQANRVEKSFVIKEKNIAPRALAQRPALDQENAGQIPGQTGKLPLAEQKDRLPAGIEVANGNGVEGMARCTAGYLKRNGLRVRKISNASHFNIPKTQIYYQDGYLQEAYLLSSFIPGRQDFTKVDALSSARLHVKLVLGQDMISNRQILQ